MMAKLKEGAVRTKEGLYLAKGKRGWAQLDNWSWGGVTTFEAYLKFDDLKCQDYQRIFAFGQNNGDDRVYFSNDHRDGGSHIHFSARRGSLEKTTHPPKQKPSFSDGQWTHVVITVSGSTLCMYKNGSLAETKTDGHELNTLTRESHCIGCDLGGSGALFNGTIAYLRIWHDHAVNASRVRDLYNARDKRVAPLPPRVKACDHSFDMRGLGGDVTDRCSDRMARLKGGAVRTKEGLYLAKGKKGWAQLDTWKFGGGPSSFETFVKYDNFDEDCAPAFYFGQNNGDDSLSVLNENRGGKAQIYFSVDAEDLSKGSTTFDLDWTHVVVTVSDSTMRIYKNGRLAETASDGHEPDPLTRECHCIGSERGAKDFLHGTVAYLRTWHGHSLTASEVKALYEARNN